MPYVVNKRGSQYCVYKVENKRKKQLKGACHATRSQAIKQMQAIYINEHGLSKNA